MTMLIDLWNANQFLAQIFLEHPFVQGIAIGTLPPWYVMRAGLLPR